MLSALSDSELLEEIVQSVRTEKRSTLCVLEQLAEVDSRRLWLKEGYSSLFDFCVRKLNYSDGEAARRIHAARCMIIIPEVKPLLEQNALSLTGISQVAPHITKANAPEVLAHVQGKSTREIDTFLDERFPEARPQEEFLKVRLDSELKELLALAQRELSEKNEAVLLKKVLKKFLLKRQTKSTDQKAPDIHVAKSRGPRWPQRHTRYIPRSIQRIVRAESSHSCTFKSKSGVKCNQTAHLHIDHVRPWAKGGSSWDASNLRLLCRAHNWFLGSQDFPHRARDVRSQRAPVA
jgi:hypothetical protein